MVDTFVDWEDIDSVSVDIGQDIQAHSLVEQTVLVGRTDLFKKEKFTMIRKARSVQQSISVVTHKVKHAFMK